MNAWLCAFTELSSRNPWQDKKKDYLPVGKMLSVDEFNKKNVDRSTKVFSPKKLQEKPEIVVQNTQIEDNKN